jgi:hypothetical protein
MPGQRRTVRPRTRGSWLPILAGLGSIVVVAGAGTAAYLLAFHPARPAGNTLPQKVLGYQTVGLIGQPAQAPGGASLVQLLSPRAGPTFSPVQPSEAVSGIPEWTADQMAGGTYIFIYLPTGECLTSTGEARRPALTVRHCELSNADQRWRRLGGAQQRSGHDFYEFANLGSGKCISQLTTSPAQTAGAGLTTCDPTEPVSQLIAFWWSAN